MASTSSNSSVRDRIAQYEALRRGVTERPPSRDRPESRDRPPSRDRPQSRESNASRDDDEAARRRFGWRPPAAVQVAATPATEERRALQKRESDLSERAELEPLTQRLFCKI